MPLLAPHAAPTARAPPRISEQRMALEQSKDVVVGTARRIQQVRKVSPAWERGRKHKAVPPHYLTAN